MSIILIYDDFMFQRIDILWDIDIFAITQWSQMESNRLNLKQKIYSSKFE